MKSTTASKIIFVLLIAFNISYSLVSAQNDTMYIMKSGVVINKQSIKLADVDSIIFYKPTVATIQTVLIPSGTFTMGSPNTELFRLDDETQFTVTLSSFRMSKYEITNAQFATFLNAKNIGSDGKYSAGNYPSQALVYVGAPGWDYGLHYNGTQWIPVSGYENAPIVYVTWFGAAEYAAYVGGLLPTEAQWEYACRAAANTPFNTGGCLTNLQANYWWLYPYSTCINTGSNGLSRTQQVGTYPANAYGLYDMHGNVWEWCSDWYGTYATTAQTNPTGATTGSNRVIRGGGWRDDARSCRSSRRSSGGPGSYSDNIGFRVAFAL
ncbi:MAG: formylglycine-generating enzyme family protein [Paludibacter sp.]